VLQHLDQAIARALQGAHRHVQDRQAHTAGDVDPDCVGNHGVVGGEDAADGQAVADVGVRHQGAGHRNRQSAGVVHLPHRVRLELGAPLAPGCGFGALGPARSAAAARDHRAGEDRGQFAEGRVFQVGLRIADHGPHLVADLATAQTVRRGGADELQSEVQGRALGQPEFAEFACFHTGHATPLLPLPLPLERREAGEE
jgi:hypothetical protein